MSLSITVSLIVATLLLFILLLSLCTRHFANRDLRILSDLAEKYAGKISIDSFSSSATMDFPHRGVKIKFYQRKGIGGKSTRCCLRCDVDYSTSLSMHIAKGISGDTTIAELRSLMFTPRVDVGSERFNQEFVVRGNNHSFLNALLATEFEKRMISLGPTDPVLYLHPKNAAVNKIKGSADRNHSLEFSVNQAPRRSDELEKLIDDGLALVRRFLGANAART